MIGNLKIYDCLRMLIIFQYFEHALRFFFICSNQKKTCIDFLRRTVQFSARELASETISYIWG